MSLQADCGRVEAQLRALDSVLERLCRSLGIILRSNWSARCFYCLCIGERLQGAVYFCDSAILTAQLVKLDLRVLSARGFNYKPGTGTGSSSPGKSPPPPPHGCPLGSSFAAPLLLSQTPARSRLHRETPRRGLTRGWKCPRVCRGAVRCSSAKL